MTYFWFLFLGLLVFTCQNQEDWDPNSEVSNLTVYQLLSEYGILNLSKDETGSSQLIPQKNGFQYTLNTPLFSDYAEKERVIFLPEGKKMRYHKEKEFQFPVGSIISKTFIIPEGFQRLDGKKGKFLETRLLLHKKEGWFAVSYLWDGEDGSAKVAYAGAQIPMKTKDGEEFLYQVPSRNQCALCHQSYEEKKQSIVPIGIKAKHLNKEITYSIQGELVTKNQLKEMKERGILDGLPLWAVPKVPDYMDSSYSLESRARAYLDINCAHCHNKNAAAGMNSQLVLNYEEKDLTKLGFCATPGSAGKGGGGLRYDIVPGKPEQSILYYRVATQDPGAMMPQIGRALVHQEGVDLIYKWIQALEGKGCP